MSQLAEPNRSNDLVEIPPLPPLPTETPPPLPASASMPSFPSLTTQPPPSLYQAQYIQYMQYMQYMQYAQTYAATAAASYPASSVVPQPHAGYYSNVAAAASSYASNRQATLASGSSSSSIASSSVQAKPTEQPPQESSVNKSSIKINLKFNQTQNKLPITPLMSTEIDLAKTSLSTAATPTPPPVRKSRFNTNFSNVTAEQNAFKAKLSPPPKEQVNITKPNPATEAVATATTESKAAADAKSAADIVFDIHKWPTALKTYCTKVYQNYANVYGISEDQVTKYLQKRITETFKLKPDLNIAWESEPVPSLEEIRKEAPLSQQQIMQQKKQEAALLAARARASQILASKQLQLQKKESKQQVVNGVFQDEETKTPKKRKNRSHSRSSSRSGSSEGSSSSSMSSDGIKILNGKKKTNSSPQDFIALADTVPKNKNSKKFLLNGKKKMLKNIQINNLNGKSTYSFEAGATGKNGRLENRLKNNLSFTNENRSESDSGSGDEGIFKSAHKRQLSTKLANRQERFKKTNSASERLCYIEDQSVSRKNLRNIFNLSKDEMDYTSATNQECIGQCTDLEKEYLRLTGPPEAHLVRPQHVLEKSLEFVLKKYEQTKNYRYICEQLKSIRQDLSVQWIQNEFTIEVYETHARIAIKNKDRDEFNQCQSKLKSLYALMENKENSESRSKIFENSAEFIGYRLLYSMLTKSHTDLNQVIKEIKLKYSGHAYLGHLLSLRNALHLNNYVKFFRLYAKSNEMSKCLIDLFIERVRKLALKIIIKSYRPSIKLECLSDMLAYESVEKCKEDLLKYQLTIQSVPIVSTTTTATSTNSLESSGRSQSSPNLNTTLKKNKNLPEKPQFEEVLDCKSCTLQGL